MSEFQLAEVARPLFARHETFAPRFGWLHKAFVVLQDNNGVFLEKDAPVRLGVGKNMAYAIRYWMAAFKLTAEYPRGGTSRAYAAAPTWQACWLLSEDGADPYLEDPGSLWLLHWWLLAPRCHAPTWSVAFHALPSSRFTQDELVDLVGRHVSMTGWPPIVPASIEKDVDCLTKMYAPRKSSPASPGSFEDLLDCPFRELGLLQALPGTPNTWQFTSVARASLPPRVAAYACLDYASHHNAAGGSIALARLANEPGGPGRAFQIREPELAVALESVRREHDGLQLTDTLGQRSLVFGSDPKRLAWDILDAHYDHARQRVSTEEEWHQRYPELRTALERQWRATPEVQTSGQSDHLLEETV